MKFISQQFDSSEFGALHFSSKSTTDEVGREREKGRDTRATILPYHWTDRKQLPDVFASRLFEFPSHDDEGRKQDGGSLGLAFGAARNVRRAS